MDVIYIVGTAGAGKSLLTSAFSNFLELKKYRVISVNLDPGVITLPYSPDVDVREYVSIYEIMENYRLGPNGALMMAIDLLASKINLIKTEIEEFNADYVLIDTPGQIEFFAFRESGPYIVNELFEDSKVMVYLFDTTFSASPLNYVSNMFLATAVYLRFPVPQIYILSKVDLIPKDSVEKILNWGMIDGALEDDIDEKLLGTQRIISRDVIRLIHDKGLSFTLIPVSSKSGFGFLDLHSCLTRISSGGEEPM